MSIPSLERLQADLGQTYVLMGVGDAGVPAELRKVSQGIPMSERYHCYSALLALPPGMGLDQLSCTVCAGADQWPYLLLTPVGVDQDGCQLMEMVFHSLAADGEVTAGEAY